MDDDLYQDILLDHYKNPRHFGTIAEPTVMVTEQNASCGDEFSVALKVTNQTIEDIKFTGVGCAVSTAAASLLSEDLIGEPVSKISTVDDTYMQSLIGATISPLRLKCLNLISRALKQAVKQLP